MGDQRLVIPYVSQTTADGVSLRGARTALVVLLVFGSLGLAYGLLRVGFGLATGQWTASDFEAVPALVVGGGLVYVAVRGLRRVAKAHSPDEILPRGAYVVAVTPTSLDFPGTQSLDPESWDRGSTTATISGRGPRRRLKLSCPGHGTRYYRADVLGLSPEQVVALVAAGRETS